MQKHRECEVWTGPLWGREVHRKSGLYCLSTSYHLSWRGREKRQWVSALPWETRSAEGLSRERVEDSLGSCWDPPPPKFICWIINPWGDIERWCQRKLLRVPWTARRFNQSILKEINPEYSLEGLMLKLKLQYFGHLMWRTDSLEKTLMLEKIEGGRRRGRQKIEMVGWHHWLNGHGFE